MFSTATGTMVTGSAAGVGGADGGGEQGGKDQGRHRAILGFKCTGSIRAGAVGSTALARPPIPLCCNQSDIGARGVEPLVCVDPRPAPRVENEHGSLLQERAPRPQKSGNGARLSEHASRLEQDPAFANSDIAAALIEEAARQEGVDTSSLDLFGRGAVAGVQEDPDKFWFAEDGDDDGGGGKTRRSQDLDLPALRAKHADNKYEDFEKGIPFVKGEGDEHAVDANDVKQGALGDCYLIAGMAAVARANPKAIQDLIKDNNDGTFDVTLYLRSSQYGRPRKAMTTTVDAQLAVKSAGQAAATRGSATRRMAKKSCGRRSSRRPSPSKKTATTSSAVATSMGTALSFRAPPSC